MPTRFDGSNFTAGKVFSYVRSSARSRRHAMPEKKRPLGALFQALADCANHGAMQRKKVTVRLWIFSCQNLLTFLGVNWTPAGWIYRYDLLLLEQSPKSVSILLCLAIFQKEVVLLSLDGFFFHCSCFLLTLETNDWYSSWFLRLNLAIECSRSVPIQL